VNDIGFEVEVGLARGAADKEARVVGVGVEEAARNASSTS
jgi:hypothetical protein